MKRLTLFLTFSCAVWSLFGQLSIAPQLGLNVSSQTLTGNLEGVQPALHYYVGIQAKNMMSERWATGLGLLFIQKGYRKDGSDLHQISAARLNYLEIMPFVEFKPSAKLGILAGGSVGFNLHEGYDIIGARDRPILTLNDPLDLCGVVGLRYYVGQWFISSVFSHSLASVSNIIYTDENGNPDGESKTYNRSLMVGVGYEFGL